MNMSNNKVKGLLKGLRYISQIFDNEKEQEIQIGYPTDVKHVAHIGWDGPSVNSPSWMGEFQSPHTFSSGPLEQTGDGSQDSISGLRSGLPPASPGKDLPEKPKPMRRHSNGGSTESPTKAKSDKSKPRRHKKESSYEESSKNGSARNGSESPAQHLPGIPKKSRRKKSKDDSVGSSRLRSKAEPEAESIETYASPYSDIGTILESGPKSASGELNSPTRSPLKMF